MYMNCDMCNKKIKKKKIAYRNHLFKTHKAHFKDFSELSRKFLYTWYCIDAEVITSIGEDYLYGLAFIDLENKYSMSRVHINLVLQLEGIKLRTNSESKKTKHYKTKIESTCMSKYGKKNNFLILDSAGVMKREKTFLEKYGVKNSFSIKKVQEKAIQTLANRDYNSKQQSLNKYKDSVFKKFGVYIVSKNPEIAKKISKTHKEAYKKGIRNVSGGSALWYEYSSKYAGTVKVQGVFELRTCKILDRMAENGKILNWGYPQDRVSYIGPDGNEHTYILDFKLTHINGDVKYIEIKTGTSPKDRLKWAYANKKLNLEVWFVKDLSKIEKELNIC